jgi:hypothetical protein
MFLHKSICNVHYEALTQHMNHISLKFFIVVLGVLHLDTWTEVL